MALSGFDVNDRLPSPRRGKSAMVEREALLAKTLIELADALLSDFDVVDLLTLLADRCVEALDVDGAGIMLADADGALQVMASSSQAMAVLELLELQVSEGPCLDCFATGLPVVNSDMASVDSPWPQFATEAVLAGFNSAVALPMRLRGTVIGALNLFHAAPVKMPEADIDAAQALADIATIAIMVENQTNVLRTTMSDLADANRATSAFVSRMSHELRTPLNAVLGFAQLLELGELDDEAADSVSHIIKAGSHLLALINEVLDITRVESGELAVQAEDVDVEEVIRESVGLMRPAAAHHSIRITTDADPVSHRVVADGQRLKQILLNLISNAVKYNRVGGTVNVGCQLIGHSRLRINVADTGPGIRPEHCASIFTPFERLGAERTDVEGSGIGLSLSRRLAEAMSGTLDFETTFGEGSTFFVELPLVSNDQRQRASSALPSPDVESVAASASRPNRRSVVYIEDDLANMELVQRVLAKRTDVQMIPAMQGRLGAQLAQELRPGLVLLDLNLPDMSGEDVLKELRDHPSTASIPIVIVSADASPERLHRLIAAGATAYLTKPIDVPQLILLVEALLADGHLLQLSDAAPLVLP